MLGYSGGYVDVEILPDTILEDLITIKMLVLLCLEETFHLDWLGNINLIGTLLEKKVRWFTIG